MILTDAQIAPIDTKKRREVEMRPGDTVRIHQKITEKERTRIQVFEGVVIARKHGTEPGATFTVRRTGSDETTVEKIFPLYSPIIDAIEVIRKARTRRAKLYFLREKTPRQAREKLRRTRSEEKPKNQKQEQEQEKVPSQQETAQEPADQEPTETAGEQNDKA